MLHWVVMVFRRFLILYLCVDSYVYTLRDIPEVVDAAANNRLLLNSRADFSTNIPIYIQDQSHCHNVFFVLMQWFIQKETRNYRYG